MKKFLSVAGIVLFLSCGSAGASDVPGGTYNWTGFYVGLNLGAAVNDTPYTVSPSGSFSGSAYAPSNSLRTDSANITGGAFTGGAQFGYNYQSGSEVLGLETDFNYNSADNSDSDNRALQSPLLGRFYHSVTEKVDYFGTLRCRLGYTPADRLLLYATGGLAYGDVSSKSDVLFTGTGDRYIDSSSVLQVGWTVGGGVEYAINGHWSVKSEYLLVDLGSSNYTYGAAHFPGFTYTTQMEATEHVFRLGVNYKF